MKITLEWLKDFVAVKQTAGQIAEGLTKAGLPVASIECPGKALAGIVTGRILQIAKHPKADRLTVCRVDVGAKTLTIVCGAKNMKEQDMVPVATVGTVLPGGMRIEEATIRGEASFGMMCSKKELGLSGAADPGGHEGLYILPAETPVGIALADALNMKDTVLDVEITPNRGDCLSVMGLAREIAAITGAAMKAQKAAIALPAKGPAFDVRIDAKEGCGLYACCVLENVKAAPSPAWLAKRLELVGLRSINNVVDITNYVLWAYGQPLHAFDADRLQGGRINVRKAKAGERIKTIDQSEIALQADTLIIADAERPVALAGVMGGSASQVDGGTRRVLLEGAYFFPDAVRKSSKQYHLSSESSYRFERGVDPAHVLPAMRAAIALLMEIAGAVPGPLKTVSAKKFLPKKIQTDAATLSAKLGMSVKPAAAAAVYKRLGFGVKRGASGKIAVTAPLFRNDVQIAADLAEEFARIQGYESIPIATPTAVMQAPEGCADPYRALREAMLSQGFDEAVHLSFIGAAQYRRLAAQAGWRHDLIEIDNPLDQDQRYLRPTLADGLLANIALNQNRGEPGTFVFEIGHVFEKEERPVLAFAACGPLPDIQWEGKKRHFDFFDAKGALEELLQKIGARDWTFAAEENGFYQPGQAAALRKGASTLGLVGKVHPAIAAAYDIRGAVFFCELDLLSLLHCVPSSEVKWQAVSKFPAVSRDVALIVDQGLQAGELLGHLQSFRGATLEDVEFFDWYQGKNIPQGKKSLAYRLRYRAMDRTLTEQEVQQAHEGILRSLGEKWGCEFREA